MAWAALWTRGSSPSMRRLPSICTCTFTRSAGDASHWASAPAPTPDSQKKNAISSGTIKISLKRTDG
uniref:Uncharacterized protein n=1 Tax=Anopheles atroparvus TaxID=41427 RepID=A0AAG5D9Z4_ANOAO